MPNRSVSEVPQKASIQSIPSSRFFFKVTFLLFLCLNFIFLATSTGRVRTMDEIDSVLQSDSLLLRHNTVIPQILNSADADFGKTDRNGLHRSAWPAGHGLLVLPWNAVGHYLLTKLPGVNPENASLAITAATCWSSATFSAIAAAMFFLLCLKLGVDPRDSLICSLLLAFSTPLFVYSGWLFTEPASAAIFLAAALLLFGSGDSPSALQSILGAFLLAFSIHVRPANMVTVFVFIAASYVMDRYAPANGFRYRTTVVLVAIAGISGTLYLARNQALFGSPLDFGVPSIANNGKDVDSWGNPVWKGLFGFLMSPGKSVFLFCPPIILGILGLPQLWQRNRPLGLLCGLAPVVNLIFFSFRTQWEGGFCYGPRYLIVSAILLTVPAAVLFLRPPKWLKPALWTVAVTGLFVQAAGLAVNNLEDMVLNGYYNANFDYQMGYSPITGQLRLIWRYMQPHQERLGLGWDRWFIFLRDAGVNRGPLMLIVALFGLGAIIFGFLTWKSICKVKALSEVS